MNYDVAFGVKFLLGYILYEQNHFMVTILGHDINTNSYRMMRYERNIKTGVFFMNVALL